ncbi:hypothetical protein CPHO_08730 [Corynebacterium phocae]|uniref:Zinc-finger domain-containing protein n=1 Tax=Corynebacterium phocae TaxID=161895 RepID=A0A1L7D478_9CORY|nr:hypothetical protein [Corynebacterium phocae]APT92959.1 hypothetical protein CPHO_08730 [Corynebacterium phocae]KAA8723294.1 hypothetical protein F4V58_08235 [Corynebacterium phocae]
MLSHDLVQAAISARLDGESYEIADDVIDTHVVNCPECAAFQDRAAKLSRTLLSESRHDGMAPPRDLSESILAGVEPQWRATAGARRGHLAIARVGLAVVGLCFVAWAVTQVNASSQLLMWSADGRTLSPEAQPELAAFTLEGAALRFGVAFGLFFAAWRPSFAPGMLPVVTTMLMFLAGATMRDIALGTVSLPQIYTLLGLGGAVALLAWTWAVDKGYVLRALWRQLAADPV